VLKIEGTQSNKVGRWETTLEIKERNKEEKWGNCLSFHPQKCSIKIKTSCFDSTNHCQCKKPSHISNT